MEEPQNRNGKLNTIAEEEKEPVIGPGPAPRARPKRPLQFEQTYLDSLPSANIRMETQPGVKDSIPAWIKFSVQAAGEIPYSGVYYDPPEEVYLVWFAWKY
ncbi:hypothetical protein GOBAR_DD27792 [Gossypium barbadense]|nr:hypothetical protein GOBAR_DD27792 [Gossypium barbadense]